MDPNCHCRFKRKIRILSIMLSGFMCFTLYTLSLSCCSVANGGAGGDGDRGQIQGDGPAEVLFQRDLELEGRYQRDVNPRRHTHNRLARKTLLHHDGNQQQQNTMVFYDRPSVNVRFDDIQQQQSKVSQQQQLQQQNGGGFYRLNSFQKQMPEYPLNSNNNYDEIKSNQVFQNDIDDNENDDNNIIRHHSNTYINSEDNISNNNNRNNLDSNNRNLENLDEDGDSSTDLVYNTRTRLRNIDRSGVRKLPQAIIIGVKKGGTRALLEFLRIHPDVRAPGPEPHFFDRHYHRGLEWYRRQMPPTIDGQLTLEKTPSYFVTKGVPARIYNMSHNTKLLVVVRDPVTRAISDYTQTATKRPDVKPFEQMAFLDNTTGLVDTSWGAIRIGVYAKHLERWLKYFPLSKMHFVNGEKLITDPATEMAKVQDFLGLKPVITEKHFYFNTTKGFPCLKKGEGTSNPHCLGKTKGRPHPDIDPKVLQRLRDFFRPFNAKFYQMTGIDMGWPL